MTLLTPLHKTVPLEDFQAQIVESMTDRIRRSPRPLLLRSPTGSGKTLMISRVLNDTVGAAVLWLWFVPYGNLVAQTIASIEDYCPSLHPAQLTSGRQFDHRAGDVLVSTAQTVASAKKQRDVYDPKDEGLPSLAEVVVRARANGLKIGLVIDEAHIGISSETVFGRFCHDLKPDRIIMASATPRDHKLAQFVAAAGYADFESFSVSRDTVVDARLNKRYVAAVVYEPGPAWRSLVDLRKTVLKHAWEQNELIGKKLADCGISLQPLMLVQVANGDGAVAEARNYLVKDCRVPPDVIGSYEGKDNDPGALQAIARNPAFRVLIFKEAAGTGFDAPRAFILTSMKAVVDIDFAAQFIGRIMRVDRSVRAFMDSFPDQLDPDLDTGYVYLANPSAQAGFQGAVQDQIQRMRDRFKGAIERLEEKRLSNGSFLLTNRPTAQSSFPMGMPIQRRPGEEETQVVRAMPPRQGGLFDNLPQDDAAPKAKRRRQRREALDGPFSSRAEVTALLAEMEIQSYPLRADLPGLPASFLTERRPNIANMAEVVRAVARHLPIEREMINEAARHAYGDVNAREIRTDLESLRQDQSDAIVEIDRVRLARDVQTFLADLPQSSSADSRDLILAVTNRIQNDVKGWLASVVPAALRDAERDKQTLRDATYLLLRACRHPVEEQFNAEIARRVERISAAPLPSAMVFPAEIPLRPSPKSIYGCIPPIREELDRLPEIFSIDERRWMRPRAIPLADGTTLTIDGFDDAWAVNESEHDLITRLDAADFVTWWARNPHRKPYATSVVRADSGRNFFPDFMVCVRFWDGDDHIPRLVETKFDPIDAAVKARRDPITYGKVVFLRADKKRNCFVLLNRDGSPGPVVNEDLRALKEELRESR